MSKMIIYQESFLVSGIMCFDSCGNAIQGMLRDCIQECIEQKILPSDAQLIIDAEPNGLGCHKLLISIATAQEQFIKMDLFHSTISTRIKENIAFDIIDNSEETNNKPSRWTNWINILINLVAVGIVITGAFIFPPSILLTVSLTALSFLTAAFTSREYLLQFLRNFRTQNFANMATTISLGWLLSLTHTLFHSIKMPLAASFSMIFMSFIMPLVLITCINGMDEIKRLLMEKSKKIQLAGMQTLFPQMSGEYACYQPSQQDLALLSEKIDLILQANDSNTSAIVTTKRESISFIHNILETTTIRSEKKNLLREGMLIEVKPGECFPVDCILVLGNTIVDASLLTGETQQSKRLWQTIPAGAINLGQPVTVYALKNPYNSTVNSLLFRSNRARNTVSENTIPKDVYLYSILIFAGILAAIFIPVALKIATVSLVIQNVIGILFSVCPCTIAIAHELPKLISLHQRNNKGVHLRDDCLLKADSAEIHTLVFDKTGTLTTANSVVESSDIALDSPLWQRVYLLEKTYGGKHPLAVTIQNYYEANLKGQPLFDEIKQCKIDEKNRGLTALVQGKTLHIGSVNYLQSNHINIPELNKSKLEQGFSAVCVAEEGIYKGVIYIKHEVRPGVLDALTRLKNEGKKIIMLTGDNEVSAKGFNKQINSVFANEDIHAGQTPQDKETFLKNLMDTPGINPQGVWFCGDGLNDAPCCRLVSEKGGVSCAMNPNDKSAFFTDISLNGSLDYLFKHNQLNHSLQQHISQNKGILIYSTLAFLAFILSFSVAGIAVSPLIPMAVMVSTTLFVLFNSYRTQLAVDNLFDEEMSWPKQLLASNYSLGLLLGSSALLIGSVLVATIATGGLTLPVMSFTAGAVVAFSSVCTLSAVGLFSAFLMIFATSLFSDTPDPSSEESISKMNRQNLSDIPEQHSTHYGCFFSSRDEVDLKRKPIGPETEPRPLGSGALR